MLQRILPLLLAFLGIYTYANAAEFKIDTDKSNFVVITKRAGLASAFAHNHLLVAREYKSRLHYVATNISQSLFEIEVPVAALSIDDPVLIESLSPQLAALGLTHNFSQLKSSDVAGLRVNMRSEGQLHSRKYPVVVARVVGVETLKEGGHFSHRVKVELRFRDKSVSQWLPAKITAVGPTLSAEVYGGFNFSEFDIKPFSAAAGLVRVADTFSVYVKLVARKQ